jgi:protein Mpv17
MAHGEVANLAALPLQADQIRAALSALRLLPAEWLAWYDREALEFPLITKAATSGICYSLGDFCAQSIDGNNLSTFDLGRSVRSGAAGFVGCGPLAHYYFNFLDKSLSFGGAWWAVVAKIALEEGPMAVVYNTVYSLLVDAFALRDPRETLIHIKATFMRGFIESIRVMPVVDLVTFTLVPVELQVLWNGVTEILWICIFSKINNRDRSADVVDDIA